MKQVFIIARKDIAEAFRSRSTYFYVLVLLFLAYPYFLGSRTVIDQLIKSEAGQAAVRVAGQALLDTSAYTLPLVLSMLTCNLFSQYAIVLDKAKRTLESLMATPLSLRQIWLGKSLAVTLPSIALALLISIANLIAVDLAVTRPAIGTLLAPGPASLVTGLILVPLMTFFTVAVVSYLQLTMTNPRIASFAFIVIFIGIYTSTVTELNASLNFSLIYFGVTIVLAGIALLVSRFLTTERVILSSKG